MDEKPRRLSFKVQTRIGITFLAFLILLVVSVIITFYGLDIQKQDARIMNLAGRQRMLLQQMSALAFGYSLDDENGDYYRQNLIDTTQDFGTTLNVLLTGGELNDYTGAELFVVQPNHQELSVSLQALKEDWDVFEGKIQNLLASNDATGKDVLAHEIEAMVPGMVDRADHIVRIYEGLTNQKLARLRIYQLSFLGAGFIILGLGWMITHQSIVKPLERLTQAARDIGAGLLDTKISVDGSSETRMLSETMDQMRTQILASQKDLHHWALMLEERVSIRTRELEALASVSKEIASHLSIGEVLNSVAIKARELSAGDIAAICLLNQDGKILHLNAMDGHQATISQMQSSALNSDVGKVLHPSCTHPCEIQSCDGGCQILSGQYLASHVAVSLRSKQGVIGALCIGSQTEKAFRPEVKTLLSHLGGVTEIAIENSRLYEQAESYATLIERQRLASEMHDGSLQTISYLRLVTRLALEQIRNGEFEKAVASLQQIERAEDQAEHEIRGAIESLQDGFPIDSTLQEQLVELAGEMSEDAIRVEFASQTMLPILLDRQEREQVLRIVREAILNAKKHSRSERISVTLSYDDETRLAELRIKDLGVGFNPQDPNHDGRAHFGLKIMKARAAKLNGQVDIYSEVNSGTEVAFSWIPSTLLQGKGA